MLQWKSKLTFCRVFPTKGFDGRRRSWANRESKKHDGAKIPRNIPTIYEHQKYDGEGDVLMLHQRSWPNCMALLNIEVHAYHQRLILLTGLVLNLSVSCENFCSFRYFFYKKNSKKCIPQFCINSNCRSFRLARRKLIIGSYFTNYLKTITHQAACVVPSPPPPPVEMLNKIVIPSMITNDDAVLDLQRCSLLNYASVHYFPQHLFVHCINVFCYSTNKYRKCTMQISENKIFKKLACCSDFMHIKSPWPDLTKVQSLEFFQNVVIPKSCIYQSWLIPPSGPL